jgi:2-dehydro-3-deoxy-D-arabinonate dehydratase
MKLYRGSSGWCLEQDGRAKTLHKFDFDAWLAEGDPVARLIALAAQAPDGRVPDQPELPMGTQEVWLAGVTYHRSKIARMEESSFSANAYDRIYDAVRPELAFKATPRRCVGTGGRLRLRADSKWNVPEPELTLLVSAHGKVVGYTVGNDLSSRDIEGDNLLYLTQAKVWDGCCALGPCILIEDGSTSIRRASIGLSIRREGNVVFTGEANVSQMKRTFDELVEYLFRDQSFPTGVYLLTGTCIVPNNDFTLKSGDIVDISIAGIGTLTNVIA